MSVCSKKVLLLILPLLLLACSHDPSKVQVKELRSPPRVTSGIHVVREGETLFSIAWFYGRDFRELSDSNNIRSPYTIYPGQNISLAEARRAPPPSRPVVARQQPAASQNTRSVKKQPVPPRTQPAPSSQPLRWRWPVNGQVIQGYSLTGTVNKGIDIGGNLGEPVMAASGGEVVYAGSDLAGYGRLIILKHNNSYLSAYAHNRELLVREGDSVKAGQKIAEIGSTGTTEPKLHFEIRRNGKPVDPMRFLPKR
ncbi:MAG: peptidoglycan DD-metalloendopeptidase family protein [Endozoicomonas sp.]